MSTNGKSMDQVKSLDSAIVCLLKALSNERRINILWALKDGEMCVSELEKQIDLSQSALSQHLAKLRSSNLVKTRRDAQNIYYAISEDSVKDVLQYLHEVCTKGGLGNICGSPLQADAE